MTTRLTQLTLENETQSKRISQLTEERDALAIERTSLTQSNEEMSKKLDDLSRQLDSLEGRVGAMAEPSPSRPSRNQGWLSRVW